MSRKKKKKNRKSPEERQLQHRINGVAAELDLSCEEVLFLAYHVNSIRDASYIFYQRLDGLSNQASLEMVKGVQEKLSKLALHIRSEAKAYEEELRKGEVAALNAEAAAEAAIATAQVTLPTDDDSPRMCSHELPFDGPCELCDIERFITC